MASFNDNHQTIFMKNVYTVTSSFRHTFEIERALQKAAREKNATKAHVIYCCLTGQENLNRYLDEFDEDDLNWIHEQKLKVLRERKQRSAVINAAAEHAKVNERYFHASNES